MIPLLDKALNSKTRWIKAIFNLLALRLRSPADISNSAMNTSFESVPLSESVELVHRAIRSCSVSQVNTTIHNDTWNYNKLPYINKR